MLVGWGILSPLSKRKGWAPGPVGSMTDGARGWILWSSLSIMVADSVVSLMPVLAEYVLKQASAFKRLYRKHSHTPVHMDGRSPMYDDFPSLGSDTRSAADKELETEDRLVPMRWVLWGLLASVVLGIFVVWGVFGDEGIKPYATFVAFVVGGLLSVLGFVHFFFIDSMLSTSCSVRALGETDLNPVSGLGKISQLLFAVVQPGNVVANIIAGGVAEAGAQQYAIFLRFILHCIKTAFRAGDLMQDLKTGHLIGASPRAQFYGQLIGSALSIFVTATAYSMYQRAYTIPGPEFPAPTAHVWLSLARLLRDGTLPPHTNSFMLSFAIGFGCLSAVKAFAGRRGSGLVKYIPSGVAFAIGFLNTPSFSLARLVGGVLEYLYRRHVATKDGQDIRLIIIASGFVLGEGVISVITLVLRTFNVGVASCWGCGHGLCGGCPANP
jgi:OPT family oligopeptide transporter